MDNNTIDDIDEAILSKLKDTKEQKIVVGPMVKHLVSTGWALDQIMFGREEWLVPKTPSEQTKREQGRKYAGFPVDITVFDDPNHLGDWRHVLFLIECKQPTIEAGLSQLESYFVGEPHARLGVWANNPDSAAPAAFVYRRKNGSMQVLRKSVHSIPRPGEVIQPDAHRMTLNDLIPPSADVFQKTISDILDKVVIEDPNVTRREEQLDQICNILLLKLESDKQAKANPDEPVFFQPMESPNRTAKAIRERYTRFVQLYPDTFTTEQDKTLKFSDDTLASCVDLLCGLRIIDLGLSTVSLAFQVLRSEALKQNEGQYFTPHAVIEAGVRLMQIQWDDIIIDPACGTGGFLVECLTELKRRYSNITPTELSRWAQTHIHGIEKDAIGLKLTKAIMQIAGDGSAHCARGDSVRIHKWSTDFPHLAGSFNNGRFTVVITNPPFGENLKVSANDSRLSRLEIAKDGNKHYQDLEIGLLFLQRAYDLLDVGGRVGIVLPETYFFSPTYKFVQEWMKPRFKPKVVLNVPMEAFQGFCRAKTNFYVFEKIKVEENKRMNENREDMVFLNPCTCGIYKNGKPRYKIDPLTGERTTEIDNDMIHAVEAYLSSQPQECEVRVSLDEVYRRGVIVPTYYDRRYNNAINNFLADNNVDGITLGELIEKKIVIIRAGHGSPGNDQRNGIIPYVKVSDIRGLRINVNPTNLIPLPIARRHWRGESSGLQAWDLITPNRASSNIGEFAILLPGEETIVLTKEVFVIRVIDNSLLDPFYLLWALSLKAVRDQWRRIALMQTNREDCGERYKEIILPSPPNREWAMVKSKPFRDYFLKIAEAKGAFIKDVSQDPFEYIASVTASSIGEMVNLDEEEN